jgi:hypothetical protein
VSAPHGAPRRRSARRNPEGDAVEGKAAALPDLPDEVWDIVMERMREAPMWCQLEARCVCASFRDSLRPWEEARGRVGQMSVELPGLGVHAARSLSSHILSSHADLPPPHPLSWSLHSAVRRTCSLCGARFSGSFVLFAPSLLVYAHPSCVRRRCVASFWVENAGSSAARVRLDAVEAALSAQYESATGRAVAPVKTRKEEDGSPPPRSNLHARCLSSPPGAMRALPRWTCQGYHHRVGSFSYDLILVEDKPGVIPSDATIWTAI